MNAREILEWLCASLESACENDRRIIVRFPDESEYELFLHAWRTKLPGCPSLGKARPLRFVRAVSFPCPAAGVPEALGDRVAWEEDAPVQLQALPRGAILADKGIPWGVGHIGAPQAWSRTTGHRVKIGVIDTGVDFMHPDLRHSLERGINLMERTALPQDDNGHGTHIVGTIAAANRMQGMIGVAPRSVIYPVKAFDHNGTAFVSDIILGIEWCVRNRMDIVNMSFGMKTRSKSLFNAVNNAYRSGVLIVASSGNDGRIGKIDYPARYGQTIAVGATNRQGRIAPFTNRSGMIDVYAPGEKIVSAWLRGKYREMSGTSMATSHVTGAIALLLALKPNLSPEQIKTIVSRSAMPLRSVKIPSAGELSVTRMIKLADGL